MPRACQFLWLMARNEVPIAVYRLDGGAEIAEVEEAVLLPRDRQVFREFDGE